MAVGYVWTTMSIVIAGLLLWITQKSKIKLPPGPPCLPLIGNLHQVPAENPWRKFHEWTKQYGPIFRLRLGSDIVIILGTHESAHDLLDKRNAIYSSRPRSIMGQELVSKNLRTLLMPYDRRYQNHQQLQASVLNPRASETYKPVQDVESKQLIYDLLQGSQFKHQYHRYTSSVIFALAFGKRLPRGDEPEMEAIDQISANFIYAARVGTWIVDSLPFLNHLPSFLAPWKRHAEKLHRFEADFYLNILREARKTRSWNWVKQVEETMKSKNNMNMPELEIAYTVGILYEAASDTTAITLEVFTMAAVLYPETLQAAREELDSVVGRDRLPTFDDLRNLPQVQAVLKETLRWRPVSAGGVPHCNVEDDVYMGYDIPKGSIVIGNHWALHHDAEQYDSPHEFNPQRWIDDPSLPLKAFGFGRRVCTGESVKTKKEWRKHLISDLGQHIAKNSLFIAVARLLWAYKIGPTSEEVDGVSVTQQIDPYSMTQGFNSRPQPFKASFEVHDNKTEKVIRSEWGLAETDVDALLDSVESRRNRSAL